MGEKIEIVSNSYLSLSATSVDDLASAMQYCSNSSKLVGVDIDRLIGYLGTIEEVTQSSGESVGNMWKTVTARYSNVKLGQVDEDGLGINDVEKALARVDVAIRDSKGSFRDMQDVLDDVAKGWKNYDEVTKSSITTALAGTRQREYMLSLLENYDRALELSGESADSAGLAQDRYNIYLESTKSKLNTLKTTMQELYTSLLSSGFINMFIDGTTGVLNFISALGGLPTVIAVAISSFIIMRKEAMALMAINAYNKLHALTSSVVAFIANGNLMANSIIGIKGAFSQAKNAIGLYNKGVITSKTLTLALTPALNLLSVGLMSVVSAISLYVAWQNKEKEKRQEEIQSHKEQANSAQELVSKMEELKTQYEELSNTKNRSEEQNKQLLDVQKQLNEVLGLENGALDASNQTWEERIDLINEATKAKLDYAITKQADVVTDEKENYNKSAKNGIYDDSYLIYDKTGFMSGFNATENKAFEELKKKLKEVYGDLLIEDNNGSIYFDKTKMSAEELNKAIEYTHTLMQNSKGLNKEKYDEFATSVGKTTEAYNTFTEAQQKQYEMQSKVDMFDLGKTQEDITNMTEQQTQSFKKSFAELNKGQNPSYIQYFYDMVDGIQADKKALDNLNNTQGATSSSWDSIASSFEGLSSESDILETALDELSSTQTLTEETLTSLAEKYPELASKMGTVEEAIGGISQLIAEQNFDKVTQDISDLTSILEDLEAGNGITASSFKKLSETFPDLLGYMDDEASLTDAISDKMNNLKETQNQAYAEMLMASDDYYAQKINSDGAWVTATESNLNSLLSSLGSGYQVDLTRYKNMEEAKAVITSKLIEQLGDAWAEYFGMIADGMSLGQIEESMYINGDDSMGSNMNYEAYNQAKKVYDSFQKIADSFATFKAPDIKVGGTKSSSGSGGSSSEADSIKDKYDKIIEQILSSTNEIERAIELSNQKIEMAELLGDEVTANKEKENLIKLYDDRKKLIHEQAEQLRELLKTVNDEEVRATIGEKIVGLQDSYHDIQMTKLEDRIELVKKLHDTTINGLNDELDLLNQQRTLMNQDSDEYKGTYAQEYKIVLNQQLATIKSINDLKAQGYSMESDAIKELKDEWQGYESTRLEIIKSIAEANKQSQLDSLEKANEGLESLLDMTMDMIKQRYDDEKEMIQDLIDERDKAVQKEIDGYKAIIEAKKKMLKDEQDARSYQQDLAEKQQSISDKENRLGILAKDDSDKAKAEYKKLYDELSEAKQDLENYQYDHSIELQETALDEELQRYEDAKNAELENYKSEKESELKALEDYTSKEVNIREEAMQLIKGKSKDFYDDLMAWNTEYGDGMTTTVVNAWENGYTAMDKYNGGLYNVLDTIQKISAEMESINTAPLSQFVDTTAYNANTSNVDTAIKTQATTTQSDKAKQQLNQQKYLHDLAVEAQKDGNKQLLAWIETERLKWGMDKYGKIIKQYHTGGFVGDLKSNEEFAKLLKGEFVVTDKMQNNFMKNVIPKITGTNSTPSVVLNVDRFMDIDKIDNGTDIKKLSKELVDNVFNQLVSAKNLKFGR